MNIHFKIVFKKLMLLFLSLFLLFSLLFLVEIAYRIKYLGVEGTIKSFIGRTTQPSVLGTNNWVISDLDLDYRLNPEQTGVNKYSMKDKEITVPKPSSLIRIVVLGDSIPFTGNPNFVELLKSKFSNKDQVEILNASTPGYTTYQELIFLEKYLIKIEPDIVILSYCLNDNYTFLHRFDETDQMLWTDEAKKSLKINNSTDAFINKSYFLTSLKAKVIQKRDNQKKSVFPWEDVIDFNIAWKDYSWPDFSEHLNKMNSILKKHNGKLYVVIFPLEMQLDPVLVNQNKQIVIKPQQEVTYYSQKFDIPYLDLFQTFYANSQVGVKLFTDGIHLSPDGINLTANTLYDFLLNDVYFRLRVNY